MVLDWLWAAFTVAGFLVILFGVAWRNTRRQVRATRARRPNVTEAQFMELMANDVSGDAARFLWQTALSYLEGHEPLLTPHPDDDLIKDLPIDHEDISLDWPREWAEQRGFHESNLPDWPKDWPVTIRNYGRWLDMGPQ